MELFILPLIRAFPQSLIIRAGRDSGIVVALLGSSHNTYSEQEGMPVI